MPTIALSLCGDVMTGRGVDQILSHPGDPRLCEGDGVSALRYVELAEMANGPIRKPVDEAYIWGAALDQLRAAPPDAWIVNLETSITTRGECWPKGINYKMNPANVGCLTSARIDCCNLANNHVMDWGRAGLLDTLETLQRAGIAAAGAGRNIAEAEAPAIREIAGKGRLVVFGFGVATSGIPRSWAAGPDRPGVDLLPDLSSATMGGIAARIGAVKRPGDVVIASIHWGENWDYRILPAERSFAHALIERAGVDIVHGHSSHHPKGVEVHEGKLILYGCGDFLDDYEGIPGYEEYRDDLVLLYQPTVDADNGRLVRLAMAPFQIRNMRLNRASARDATWLRDRLNREGAVFGTSCELTAAGVLELRWR